MTQLRKHYGTNRSRMRKFRIRANQRAAKERLRMERAAREETMPDTAHVSKPRMQAAWARVRIYFRDGTSAGFSTHETPFGLSVSPTLAGQKTAAILANHKPCDSMPTI